MVERSGEWVERGRRGVLSSPASRNHSLKLSSLPPFAPVNARRKMGISTEDHYSM